MSDIILYALGISLGVNFIFFLIAYTYQTDKLTDMTYSLTFIMIAIVGLLKSEMELPHYIIAGLVVVWAIRLGSFLMRRVHKMGRDDRFDDLRPYALKFLGFWTMQALTCFIVSLAALILFADDQVAFSPILIAGVIISVVGLLIETIADNQKYNFKNKYPAKFMNSGLWKRIRHPNYTGEILFWTGLSIAAISAPFGAIGLLSPIWITFILIRFSGIPLLREKWEKRYGSDPKFQEYKEKSWYLIPYLY